MKEQNSIGHYNEWLRMKDSQEPFEDKLSQVFQWFFQHPSLNPRFIDKLGQKVYNPITEQFQTAVYGFIGGLRSPRGSIFLSKNPIITQIVTMNADGMNWAEVQTTYDLFSTNTGGHMGLKTCLIHPFRGVSYFNLEFPTPISPEDVLDQAMQGYDDFYVWFGREG